MRPSSNPALIAALAVELKACRQEQGMTQEDLAALAQLDRPYLSLIEVGRKQPTLSVLYKLSLALGLGFGVFMGRVEQRYRNAPRPQKDH